MNCWAHVHPQHVHLTSHLKENMKHAYGSIHLIYRFIKQLMNSITLWALTFTFVFQSL